MKIHIVQKGDTLWKIAKKYGVNFEELKKMNTQLSNPDMIMPGMKIKVPGSGGSIKKEAPIGGMPEAKISMGAKKEMPIAEHPFAKEKPKTLPVVEAPQEMPKAPIKEVPIKEAPIQVPPKMEAPIVMAPKTEAIKEVPVKPFVPKMPKPVVPEIDINNYYMMNMANLSAQQPPPKEMPQLPPKPVNILPPVKPIVQESPESIESESSVHIHQGGFNQPMLPYYPQCYYPVSPVMPGTGLPGGYPQTYGYPQVQGAAMPMYQAPAAPMYQMPHHGLAGVESPDHYESSSSSMPMHHHHMPYTSPAYSQAQMPAPVMGAEQMAAPQMPAPQMPLEPTYTAPVMQPAYGYPEVPCPPYPAQMYPISPVMPGSGFCEPMPYAYPQMYEPYGYPQMAPMPQVQGVMEEPGMAQMPLMPSEVQMPIMHAQSQMPIMPTQSQMPLMPAQAQMPMMPVQAAKEDCGCGGPQMVQGAYNPGYGMYEMGTAPMYGAPYGQQMGYPMTGQMNPYMSPYGYGPMGGQAFGMPRSFDESSEYED